MEKPLVSIIIPTRNSPFLENCLKSLKNQTYQNIEIIIVDGQSQDNTIEVAKKYTDQVYNFELEGDHRSAQRNMAVQKATGEYILSLDSDMELSEKVVQSCLEKIQSDPGIAGLVIPEESFGQGFWSKCKKLERQFYLGVDWIEAPRFFPREIFIKAGCFSLGLSVGEDWDLGQRVERLGRIKRIDDFIYHNEGKISLFKTIKKRLYYSGQLTYYLEKGQDKEIQKKQTSFSARFKLFFSQPKKLFKDPVLGLGMLFMKSAELSFAALGYLIKKYFTEDKFIKHHFTMFSGFIVVSIFNYLYHPVLSRMMTVEDFGEAQALISMFLQSIIITGFFSWVVVNITANQEEEESKTEIISELRKVSIYISLVFFILIVVFSQQLKNFFHFDSYYPFLSLALLLIFNVLYNFRNSFLRGIHNFKSVVVGSVVMAAGRLFFAVLLVYIGWRSFGAITGLVIAQILALGYVFYKTKERLNFANDLKIRFTPRLKKEIKYGILFLITSLTVTFLYTADVLIVKHFFPPEEAGLYSGISTIARIIFYLTATTSGVLLPYIKFTNSRKQNRKLFLKAFIINIILGGGSLLIFWLFPELVIKILIGTKFLSVALILPHLGLLLVIVSVINLIFFYYLALRQFFISIIAILGIVLTLVLSYLNHSSLTEIINNFILGAGLILVLLLLRFLYYSLKFRKQVIL